jgi:hypothetical protein
MENRSTETKRSMSVLGLFTALSLSACSPVEFKTQPEVAPPNKPACTAGDTRPECLVVVPPNDVNDVVSAPARPKVDILLVMDNSESMYNEHLYMASRFNGFIDSLRGMDWQLAITTTEVTRTNTSSPATYRGGDFIPLQGGSGSILTRSTTNAQSVFESTIQMSTKSGVGPNDERGVAAATLALLPIDSSSPAGSGLVRSDAKLVVVVVTDENVRSDGGVTFGFGLEAIDSADSLLNTVRDQFGSTKSSEMKVHSVIVRPGDSVCYDRQRAVRDSSGRILSIGDLATKADGFYGDLYRSLSSRTGGITGSVCSDRYTEELRPAWSLSGAQLTEQALRCVPRASPALRVSFLDGIPNVGWRLEVNGSTAKVVFNSAVEAGGRVRLEYRCQ